MNEKRPFLFDFADASSIKGMVEERVAQFGPGTPELNIYVQAQQFHSAGHRCLTGLQREGGVELQLAPGVVCYAFAAELYLKCLHQIALGRAPRGHKLNVLFGNLSAAAKGSVRKQYANRVSGADTLDIDLVAFGNAFEDWRYIYEQTREALPVGKLVLFTISLSSAVVDLRPEWPTPGDLSNAPAFMRFGRPS